MIPSEIKQLLHKFFHSKALKFAIAIPIISISIRYLLIFCVGPDNFLEDGIEEVVSFFYSYVLLKKDDQVS